MSICKCVDVCLIYLSIRVCLSVCLSVYPSIYLSIYLSMYSMYVYIVCGRANVCVCASLRANMDVRVYVYIL